MSICEQVDALHKRLANLKSSAYQAQQETDEQIKAGIDEATAEIAVRQNAVKVKVRQADRLSETR